MSLSTKSSLLAAIVAAVGASVCCVGPLVLLALGIGGAWVVNLTALEPYRPILIGLTVLFFALAFRSLYLSPEALGGACTTCVGTQTLHRERVVFWVAAALTLGLLSVPWLAPAFY